MRSLTSTRSKAAKPAEDEELAPWEVPATEGDPTIGEGQQVEAATPEAIIFDDDVMQNMMDWCVAYMEEHAADNAAVMAAEVRRILSGEDAEAVLSEAAPLNSKDHTEKPFLLHSFTLHPTDFSQGWPFFASLACTVPGTG